MAQAATIDAPSGDTRVAWIDAAKGICIILVVMMHTTLGLGEALGREGWLHHVVAFAKPFRMPDFFLVSGLFLSRVIDRDWRSYGDKRIVHFLYFYVLWVLIQSAFKAGAVSGGTLPGFMGHLAYALVEPFGTLWFIYLLAMFSGVTKLLRRIPGPLLLMGAAILEILPIETGHVAIDEFCERYVYFVAGYLFARHVFALARGVADRPGLAVAGLVVWALVNGVLATTATGWELFPTLASLPFVSLGLGGAGALAIVTLASLLSRSPVAAPLLYCGRNSIAIYLAFFLPMVVGRMVLIRLGLTEDVGTAALAITIVAVILPLVLERLVRGTWADFLFVRPAAFHLRGPSQTTLAAA